MQILPACPSLCETSDKKLNDTQCQGTLIARQPVSGEIGLKASLSLCLSVQGPTHNLAGAGGCTRDMHQGFQSLSANTGLVRKTISFLLRRQEKRCGWFLDFLFENKSLRNRERGGKLWCCCRIIFKYRSEKNLMCFKETQGPLSKI